MKAFTDYPFTFLGDIPLKKAPIRKCKVLSYDGDKYCTILIEGQEVEIKAGYIYKNPGRCVKVPKIDTSLIPTEMEK